METCTLQKPTGYICIVDQQVRTPCGPPTVQDNRKKSERTPWGPSGQLTNQRENPTFHLLCVHQLLVAFLEDNLFPFPSSISYCGTVFVEPDSMICLLMHCRFPICNTSSMGIIIFTYGSCIDDVMTYLFGVQYLDCTWNIQQLCHYIGPPVVLLHRYWVLSLGLQSLSSIHFQIM